MGTHRPLRGSCSCGRNNYVIAIPEDATDSAHVFFDSSSESRRSQAAPLLAWLHVPLTWFQSNTTSFFPDETHTMIRKTFTPSGEPHCKRNFCGFCGTHLTYWSEACEDEANYLNITVGSLFGDDLWTLEELGLLPERMNQPEDTSESLVSLITKEGDNAQSSDPQNIAQQHGTQRAIESLTWIGDMLTGSRLGRSHKFRGSRHVDADKVLERAQWEIIEVADDGIEPGYVAGRTKRKLEDVVPGTDTARQI